ncbi:MAG: helix-turn-helix domain-containing protein [Acidimicrobiia bacterium]
MLAELSVVEQRYLAVREVLDAGVKVTDVATRYGVDRRTIHRWLVRYASGGLGALADRSSRPDRCPHQIAPEIEASIVSLGRAHPEWGPRTILNKLRRELETPPSRSAIYRCLVRHRLIDPKPRRRRRQDYQRWETSRAVELWHINVLGAVRLADGDPAVGRHRDRRPLALLRHRQAGCFTRPPDRCEMRSSKVVAPRSARADPD